MKLLFIPLKTEYYSQFVSGEKNHEIRLEGPRWNSKTCFKGRLLVLSKGYGKAHRMRGVILCTYLEKNCIRPDFVKLYGSGKTARVIKILVYPEDRKKEQK